LRGRLGCGAWLIKISKSRARGEPIIAGKEEEEEEEEEEVASEAFGGMLRVA
jgi:hypothetical protein